MPASPNKPAAEKPAENPLISMIEQRVMNTYKNLQIAKFKKSFDTEDNM